MSGDKDDNKPNLYTIESKRKEKKEEIDEEAQENKAAIIEHLNLLIQSVENDEVNHLVTVQEMAGGNIQIGLSGFSDNPFKMHYFLENSIPSTYEAMCFGAEEYYED